MLQGNSWSSKFYSGTSLAQYRCYCKKDCYCTTAGAVLVEQYWLSYAGHCVQRALDYFEGKCFLDFIPIMDAFKSARLFNPGKVTDSKPTAAPVDTLKAFPFFRDELINDLKLELPYYLAAADGTSRK